MSSRGVWQPFFSITISLLSAALSFQVQAARAETIIAKPDSIALILRERHDETITATIDYDPLPFTQGKVVRIRKADSSFVFEPDAGYAFPGNWENAKVIPFRSGVILPHVMTKLKSVDVAKKTIFLRSARLLEVLKVGDRVAIPNRVPIYHAVYVRDCSNLTLNLTINAAPQMGLALKDCSNITVNLIIDSPAGRLISTNADGMHCVDCSNITANVNINKCGDDAFNFHGYTSAPTDRNDGLVLSGAVSRCLGGVKMTGKNLLADFLNISDCQGAGLHAGGELVAYDVGPELAANQFTAGPNLQITNCGTTLSTWPAVVVADAASIPDTDPVVANIFGGVGDIQYELVDYIDLRP